MKHPRTVVDLIPARYLRQPHVVTRYLYSGRKPGRLTCLFQRHGSGLRKPLHLEAHPSSLETDREFKSREDVRIYAASYVIAGAGRLYVTGDPAVYRLGPGTLFQYNGRTMQDLRLETGDGFTECSLCMDGATGDNLARLEIWDPGVTVAQVGVTETLVRGYLDLYDSIRDRRCDSRALLTRTAVLLGRLYAGMGGDSGDTGFRGRACSVIASNLGPSFTMRRAAAMLDLPYDAFRRRFRSVVGISPIRYQLRCRIEQACVLLRHYSAKECAGILGYSDPFVFSRQFKKIAGTTPSAYRARSRETD